MLYAQRPSQFNPVFTVATCIIIVRDETLLLLRLAGKSQGGRWGSPGGKLNKGEDVEVALAREVLEETGIALVPSQMKLFRQFWVDSSGKQFDYFQYYGELSEKPKVRIQAGEHATYEWVRLDDVGERELVEDHPEVMRRFIEWWRRSRSGD